jgi:hypothetical protein
MFFLNFDFMKIEHSLKTVFNRFKFNSLECIVFVIIEIEVEKFKLFVQVRVSK